mmetsp:Transcript_91470/g.191193  ORF Transcript_91470/g.191193 Transcript_91470/m.191193 type:complete len:225 (+) Transcript_91470:1501-2175(+)
MGRVVEHLDHLGLAPSQVVNQVHEFGGLVLSRDSWRGPSENLQYHHAVAMNLATLCDNSRSDVLRTGVTHGSRGLRDLVVRTRGDAREAEVRHFCSAVPIEEDVWGLNVPVKGPGLRVVEVRQAASSVNHGAQSASPLEGFDQLSAPEKPFADVSAREVLVDQAPAPSADMSSEAHQDDEIRVPKPGEHLNFVFKPCLLWDLEDFDGNFCTIFHCTLVDAPEGA